MVGLLLGAGTAQADFTIQDSSGLHADAQGNSVTLPGTHPFATTYRFDLDNAVDVDAVDEDVKDIQFLTPPGFLIDPAGATACDFADLAAKSSAITDCAPESQVGVAKVRRATGPGTSAVALTLPIYELTTPPGLMAEYGIETGLAGADPLLIEQTLRSDGDYGINLDISDVTSGLAITGLELSFWGTVDDPAHDADRGNTIDASVSGDPFNCADPEAPIGCEVAFDGTSGDLLTTSSECGTLSETSLRVDSWQDQGNFETASFTEDANGNPIVMQCPPDFTVGDFSALIGDVSGNSVTQAAAHPFAVTTAFEMNTASDEDEVVENIKDAEIQVPPGLFTDPFATPTCDPADLVANGSAITDCAPETQVGVAKIRRATGYKTSEVALTLPVYSLDPPPGFPIEFGIATGLPDADPIVFQATLRSDSDFGVNLDATNITTGLGITGMELSLWGTPDAAAHDVQRGNTNDAGVIGDEYNCADPEAPSGCQVNYDGTSGHLVTAPSVCAVPFEFGLRTDSWEDQGNFETATVDEDSNGNPFVMIGCTGL